MTEEEADALDEYYTKNPPKIDPAKMEAVLHVKENCLIFWRKYQPTIF